MERVGAPPGLIQAYSDLVSETFPLVDNAGHTIATATAAGVPQDWASAPNSTQSNSENPLLDLYHSVTPANVKLLFLIPQSALMHAPLSIRIHAKDYALTEEDEDVTAGVAIMNTVIRSDKVPVIGAPTLLWLSLPAPRRQDWGLALVRTDPTQVSSMAFNLTSGSSSQGPGNGTVHTSLPSGALGGPVIVIRNGLVAIAGIATQSPTPASFTGTPVVTQFLRQATLATLLPVPGTPTLGIAVQTASEALRDRAITAGAPGVLVTSIVLNSAAQSGLRVGDIITAYDGRPVASKSALINYIRASNIAASHQVTVRTKNGRTQILKVILEPAQ
jgi:hypothetical protein